MKAFVIAQLLALFALTVNADLREVGYKVGPQLFREGDSIQIEKVKATATKFEVGETVVVSGTYTLSSHSEAKISIFVTQTEGSGKSAILSGQQLEIKAGEGVFELSIEVRHEGYLHVTFYPIDSGTGFGGLYFGKSKQMKEIEDWTLDWYLGRPLPEGRSDSIAVMQPR